MVNVYYTPKLTKYNWGKIDEFKKFENDSLPYIKQIIEIVPKIIPALEDHKFFLDNYLKKNGITGVKDNEVNKRISEIDQQKEKKERLTKEIKDLKKELKQQSEESKISDIKKDIEDKKERAKELKRDILKSEDEYNILKEWIETKSILKYLQNIADPSKISFYVNGSIKTEAERIKFDIQNNIKNPNEIKKYINEEARNLDVTSYLKNLKDRFDEASDYTSNYSDAIKMQGSTNRLELAAWRLNVFTSGDLYKLLGNITNKLDSGVVDIYMVIGNIAKLTVLKSFTDVLSEKGNIKSGVEFLNSIINGGDSKDKLVAQITAQLISGKTSASTPNINNNTSGQNQKKKEAGIDKPVNKEWYNDASAYLSALHKEGKASDDEFKEIGKLIEKQRKDKNATVGEAMEIWEKINDIWLKNTPLLTEEEKEEVKNEQSPIKKFRIELTRVAEKISEEYYNKESIAKNVSEMLNKIDNPDGETWWFSRYNEILLLLEKYYNEIIEALNKQSNKQETNQPPQTPTPEGVSETMEITNGPLLPPSGV